MSRAGRALETLAPLYPSTDASHGDQRTMSTIDQNRGNGKPNERSMTTPASTQRRRDKRCVDVARPLELVHPGDATDGVAEVAGKLSKNAPAMSNETTPHAVHGDESEPPPPLSRFALRDDGAWLLSIEDAADRDLEGREVQAFLVLTQGETVRARKIADDGISAAAATVIAKLPKKL